MKRRTFYMFKSAARVISKYYSNRQIVFWGADDDLKKFLEDNYGIKTELSATAVTKKAEKNKKLIDINSLKGKSNDYYIVVTSMTKDKKIKDMFQDLEYTEFKDYVFVRRKKVNIRPGSGDYNDEYGNHIHSPNCMVVLDEYICDANVNIDDSCIFNGKCNIHLNHYDGGQISIGKNCRFNDCTFTVNGNGTLTIGSNTKIGANSRIVALEGNSVNIGDDCLISQEVMMYSGDGHSIFSSKTKERLNPFEHKNKKNEILIGNHIWIGMRVIILNKCIMGNSSIVGAGSTVKGRFPNNCVIAGNPAKIVKRDVTWNKDYFSNDISECGEENICLTNDSD